MSRWVVGLDLGQASDYTALAAVEQSAAPSPQLAGRRVNHYAVRHLRRFPLGTPYPQIVDDLKALLSRDPLKGCPVAADQTGVGRAVVDMIRQARVPCWLRPVTITAGQAVHEGERGEWTVPKKELVSALQVPLQARRLAIARGLPDAATLQKELANFRVRITAAANEQFGAWREGQHDDLVLAVAMAVWLAEQIYPAGCDEDPKSVLPRGGRGTLVPPPRAFRGR